MSRDTVRNSRAVVPVVAVVVAEIVAAVAVAAVTAVTAASSTPKGAHSRSLLADLLQRSRFYASRVECAP